MVRHYDAHLHPFQGAIESTLGRLRGTGTPGLQVDRSIHLPSQAGTAGRASGNHRGQVHGRRGYERCHADVSELNARRQERTGQHDEVPGTDELKRVGTRVVDAVDRRPVDQRQHLRHLVRGDDQADLMPAPRRHVARVDRELAFDAVRWLDSYFVAVDWPERASTVEVHVGVAAQIDDAPMDGLQ